MKVPSSILFFSDAGAYMGLPPPKYGPNATFMEIVYFCEKHRWFEVPMSKMRIKLD